MRRRGSTAAPSARTYRVHAHHRVELAELFCPACEELLSVELYLANEPYRCDYRPLDIAVSQGYDAPAEYAQDTAGWISFV
jgi:hypothetical protein